MRNLRFKLPPLNSLVVFEAAARHLSFTCAAEELRISREAVSRQIRLLEKHLDQALFLRLHRSLELTDVGKRFSDTVSFGLCKIADSAIEILEENRGSSVVVSATIAIASFWLTPRLPRFRICNPHTTINITVTDNPGNMRQSGINIGLRYGDGNWPGLNSKHLFDVESIPVCSADYLKRPLL